MSENLKLVKLHEFPHLFNDCALLLNNEWPRSQTARLHSLQKSCDSLPISLILINKENRILGHIRVKKELTDTSSAFIESLVVDQNERRKGFGKYIMKETENMIKAMGFNKMTLTTVDQIEFYRSLGFVITNPQMIKKKINSIDGNSNNDFDNYPTLTSPLPPPPPPLPQLLNNNNKNQMTIKVLMHKNI